MNFFISNFKKNKNFFYSSIFGILLIYSTLFIILNYIVKKDPSEVYLVKHHLKNIKEKEYSTIFLGDSTLGNSINTNYWKILSNENSLSLALWGDISFEGHLFMLEKIKIKKIKKIYIMTGLDIWINSPKKSKDQLKLIEKYLKKNIIIFPSILKIRQIFIPNPKIINDFYENNGPNLTIDDIRKISIKNFVPSKIQLSQIQNLKKIFQICEENKLECVHFNGPLHSKFCNNVSLNSYMDSIYNLMKKNKIIFNDKILCINQSEIGNSWTHPHPNYKKKFTEKYFSLVD